MIQNCKYFCGAIFYLNKWPPQSICNFDPFCGTKVHGAVETLCGATACGVVDPPTSDVRQRGKPYGRPDPREAGSDPRDSRIPDLHECLRTSERHQGNIQRREVRRRHVSRWRMSRREREASTRLPACCCIKCEGRGVPCCCWAQGSFTDSMHCSMHCSTQITEVVQWGACRQRRLRVSTVDCAACGRLHRLSPGYAAPFWQTHTPVSSDRGDLQDRTRQCRARQRNHSDMHKKPWRKRTTVALNAQLSIVFSTVALGPPVRDPMTVYVPPLGYKREGTPPR